jgi:hypothetical protein
VQVASDATEIIKEYEALLVRRNYDTSQSWIVKRVVDLILNLPVLLTRADKVDMKLELQKITGYIKVLKGGLGKNFAYSLSIQKALIRK